MCCNFNCCRFHGCKFCVDFNGVNEITVFSLEEMLVFVIESCSAVLPSPMIKETLNRATAAAVSVTECSHSERSENRCFCRCFHLTTKQFQFMFKHGAQTDFHTLSVAITTTDRH
ncbi:hypothetical protein INR49_003682 [Caranx melampygus]|nr:hypothetical protein INR49_003682 [Caranx melampygus]